VKHGDAVSVSVWTHVSARAVAPLAFGHRPTSYDQHAPCAGLRIAHDRRSATERRSRTGGPSGRVRGAGTRCAVCAVYSATLLIRLLKKSRFVALSQRGRYSR